MTANIWLTMLWEVFLGVKFGFRKSCLCKRNDKYKVWLRMSFLPVIFFRLQFHGSSYFFSWNWTTMTMNKKTKRYITMSTAYDSIDKLLSHLWADSDNTASISAPCWLKHCSQRSLSAAMLTYPLKSNRKHLLLKKITQKQYIGCKST